MMFHSTQLVWRLTPFFNRAAEIVESREQAEIDELCRRLSGFTSHKYAEIANQVLDLAAPKGYLHVRIVDEADQKEFSASFTKTDTPVSPEMITMLVTMSGRFLTGRWVETWALPERDRGVLDLMVRFEPRAVPLAFGDVD